MTYCFDELFYSLLFPPLSVRVLLLKGYSTFFGNRLILVTRQFLVSLTSIVGKKYTMEVNGSQ